MVAAAAAAAAAAALAAVVEGMVELLTTDTTTTTTTTISDRAKEQGWVRSSDCSTDWTRLILQVESRGQRAGQMVIGH